MSSQGIAAIVLGVLLGCAHVPGEVGLRPDGSPGPEECPKKALEAMAVYRLKTGAEQLIDLDMSKVGAREITVNDGPIESSLRDPLGPLGTRTRLYGKVWTSGPYVVVRYYEAKPLDVGPPIPICGVARLDNEFLKKRPGPAAGSALLDGNVVSFRIVDGFR